MSGRSRAWRIVRRLLAVLALGTGLLFVVTLLLLSAVGRRDGPAQKRDRATLEIGTLETAMTVHRAKTGHYPDPATGFGALIDLGIIDREPRDPWGNPFRYELVEGQPVITSYGADGNPGGEGASADISSAPRMAARP